MYPLLKIDIEKIACNARTVCALCNERGIEVIGVTKCFNAMPEIAQAFVDNGVAMLADSHTDNLRRLAEIGVPKWLIRSPQISNVDSVVRWATGSLNTEPETLRALEDACVRQGISKHQIILMHELGDLREGIVSRDELLQAAELVDSLPHLELAGIGTNLGCFNLVHPDMEKMDELVGLAHEVEHLCANETCVISGGNSASLHMLMNEGLPAGITNLRLGEALLFGRERAHYEYFEGTYNDAFILECEVIEAKDKPSRPWGEIGVDAQGRSRHFEDKGIRKRAIIALGRNDFDFECSEFLDGGIEYIGSTSDHTVIDVTDAQTSIGVGDIVQIRCGYRSVLKAISSPFVENVLI